LILPKFEVYRPSSLEEALEFLDKHNGEAKPLAGGTELLVQIRDRVVKPKYLVDLSRLKNDLSYVKIEDGKVKIGALTTVYELYTSILGRDRRYAGFNDVFHGFATMSIRFMATIGGNIVTATQYSDYITLLLVYDAYLRIKSLNGERIVKLEDFLIDRRTVDLKSNELLVEIFFDEPGENCSSSFMKFDRRRLLIAGVVTNATYLCLEDDVVKDVRISFDMVRDKRIPARVKLVEEYLRGRRYSREIVVEAAENILGREMVRISDWWTSGEYRFEMSKITLIRNLERTVERIKGG